MGSLGAEMDRRGRRPEVMECAGANLTTAIDQGSLIQRLNSVHFNDRSIFPQMTFRWLLTGEPGACGNVLNLLYNKYSLPRPEKC